MGKVYDDWGRLLEAVLRREELRQLCYEHSTSPSETSSDSSSVLDDVSGRISSLHLHATINDGLQLVPTYLNENMSYSDSQRSGGDLLGHPQSGADDFVKSREHNPFRSYIASSLYCSVKPMSRVPIEPAPWKQIGGTRGSQKAASRSLRGQAKAPTVFPSVYSEIEKRLKDPEFAQSGKDLRSLKQILEAAQAKGFLKTPKERKGSNFASHKEHEQKLLSSTRSVDNRKPQTDEVVAFKTKTLSAHLVLMISKTLDFI